MKLSNLLAVGLAATGLFLFSASSQAQVVYTTGHGDIGIEYDSHEHTSFQVHWHLGSATGVEGEYAPDQVVALFSNASVGTSSTIFTALGSPTGTVYRGGKSAYQPYLGFGGHIHMHGAFVDDVITLTLVNVVGDGNFVLSDADDVYFSSYNSGLSMDNNRITFNVPIAGSEGEIHEHFDWYFSQVGRYDITLLWEAELVGGGTLSGTGTFTMYAGAIPEPGTWALMLSSAGALVVFSRSRWRGKLA